MFSLSLAHLSLAVSSKQLFFFYLFWRLVDLLSLMTVTYTARVANARFCGFSKLLWAWKGSIYKVLYKEFLAFFAMYTAISITYRWESRIALSVLWSIHHTKLWKTFPLLFLDFSCMMTRKGISKSWQFTAITMPVSSPCLLYWVS